MKKYCVILVTACITMHIESKEPPRVLVSSVLKSGTHLAGKLVTELTGLLKHGTSNCIKLFELDIKKSNPRKRFLHNHIMPTAENIALLKKHNYKTIFIYRDPRDQVASFMRFVYKFKNWPELAKLEQNDLLTQWITDCSCLYYGPPPWRNKELLMLKGIGSLFDCYKGWLGLENVYCTSFEKLIGAKGGGDDDVQLNEIIAIAQFLNLDISFEKIQEIRDRLFGGTETFIEGKIGTWRNLFTQEHRALFKQHGGQALIDWGYETGLDW